MRTALLSVIGLLTPALVTGQNMMTVYDISPNWTATDLNGNSHTLYDYLDDGYTVIIDFSTTWCPPCIGYHQTHALNNLYNLYGPGTAEDKVMVFLVEADPATGLAELQGTGGGGSFDWITGTDYPIIDDATVAEAYGVFGFPTIYTICPSRMISNYGYGGVAQMWQQAQVCGHHEVDSPNDATLLGNMMAIGCYDPQAPLQTRVYNVGSAPLTTATIEAVDVNTGLVVSSAQWTGELSTYEEANVVLPPWSEVPPGLQGVYYRLTTPDDDALNDSTLSEHFYGQSPSSPGTEVTVEILTDGNAETLSWRLGAAFGTEIDRRDAGSLADNTLYTYTYTLAPDVCWDFVIYNEAADHFEEPGYFRLHSGGTTFITADECTEYITPGSMFYHEAYFNTHEVTTGIAEARQATVGISPNPAADRITISGAGADATIQLRDAAGRLLRNERSTRADHVMDIGGLNNGAYWVSIHQGDRTTTRTLLVAH